MIFAETSRLCLRTLEKPDLPRLIELIGEWDVARWLPIVPHPYYLKDAEEFFELQQKNYIAGKPEFFALADRKSRIFMGGVGLHSPRGPDSYPGEITLGYWLGKPFWGRGFTSEAVKTVLSLAFKRPDVKIVTAMTDPGNEISRNVLRKAGLRYSGLFPRIEAGLRGGPEVTRWKLTREDYEKCARQP